MNTLVSFWSGMTVFRCPASNMTLRRMGRNEKERNCISSQRSVGRSSQNYIIFISCVVQLFLCFEFFFLNKVHVWILLYICWPHYLNLKPCGSPLLSVAANLIRMSTKAAARWQPPKFLPKFTPTMQRNKLYCFGCNWSTVVEPNQTITG